jgi:translation initiation factor 1
MTRKNKPADGYVYSTDPNFKFEEDEQDQESLLPAQQKLRIRLDTKHRAGKAVTMIEGFKGKVEELDELAKKLKSFCGTGGSVKEREIIIQGDQREKVFQWFQNNGYKLVKKN